MPLFCPACKSTYQDETLVFCLSDGTRLMPLENNAEATVQMSSRTEPGRVNLQNSEPTVQINSPGQATEKKKGAGLIIGLVAVVFLALLAAAGAVGAYFMLAGKNETATTTPTPTVASPQTNNSNATDKTNSSTASTKELEEKLNRLEKQLEDQKRANKTNDSNQTPNQTGYATAKVNSPKDGFLALRSQPSTETGTQIVKIPHGAAVTLNNCEKTTVKISNRSGRWCDVEYAGQNGYVFSAWLDF